MQNTQFAEMADYLSEMSLEIVQNIWVKLMGSFFITIVSSMYAPISNLVPLLIFLMIFDFVLGVWRAGAENRISSAGFRKGFYKIILYFCGISVICLFAATMKETFGSSLHVDVFSVGFLSANEALSCLDHLTKLGFPVPKWLVVKLQEFHDDPYAFMSDNFSASKTEQESDEKSDK